MQIIKNLRNPNRTANAIKTLTQPGVIVLADVANRETPNAGHSDASYRALHNDLRALGIRLEGAPCPYGDYTIAGAGAIAAIARNAADNAARINAGVTAKTPLQKLDLIQPNTIAIDTKSSAMEIYANLKYQSRDTMLKLRRAAQVGVCLYWLVIDDRIVDGDPSEWRYHGRNTSWPAWDDLCRLISAAEKANPHLQVFFCRRADAPAIIARMLAADYTPPQNLSELEHMAYEAEYSAAAARIRARENERELAELSSAHRNLLKITADMLGISQTELEKRIASEQQQK